VFTTHAQIVQHCHALFDDQPVRLYTRKVYLEYRKVFDKSTAFRMDPNPGMPNGFLVKHQRGGVGSVGQIMLFASMQMWCRMNIGASVINGSTLVRFEALEQYMS
jgi:hypothetical protein